MVFVTPIGRQEGGVQVAPIPTTAPSKPKPEQKDVGFFGKIGGFASKITSPITSPFTETIRAGGANFIGAFKDIYKGVTRPVTDALSRTKFFQEAGAGLEAQARGDVQATARAQLAPALLENIQEFSKAFAGRGAAQIVDTFIASPINFTTRSVFGKQTSIGTFFADMADEMRETFTTERTKKISETPFSIAKIKDPDFWFLTMAEQVPTSLLFLRVGMGPYKFFSKTTASFLGTSKLASIVSTIAGASGGAMVMRGFESAAEAEDVYKQAKEQGFSEERAVTASKNAFKDNMLLVGLDAIELAAALSPIKLGRPVLKVLSAISRVGVGGASEALEETLQQRAQQVALEQPFDITDPATKEAAFIGFAMGVLFQGAGQISQAQQESMREEYIDDVVANLPAALRTEYDQLDTVDSKQNFLERNAVQQPQVVEQAVYKVEQQNQKNVTATNKAVAEIKNYIEPGEKVEEKVKPEVSVTKIPKELESLAKEARKFKTAKEFVEIVDKKPNIVFHGTKKSFDKFDSTVPKEIGRLLGEGTYFTRNFNVASAFARDGALLRADITGLRIFDRSKASVVSPKGKISFSVSDDILRTGNKHDIKTAEDFLRLFENNKTLANKILKETGFDGVSTGDNILIFDASKIRPITKSQLTDIFNQAKGIVEPEVIKVSREQLPVGASEGFPKTKAGQERVSRLEARVRGQLKNLSKDTIEDLGLSTYEAMNKKEQITKASIYVNRSPQAALEVLSGSRPTPKGILRNSIFIAMNNMSKGDVDLARKLASLGSTRIGQELSILSEVDVNSPVKYMQELSRRKVEAYGGKEEVRNVVKKEAGSISKEMEKSVATTSEWNSFIQEITC